MTLGNMRTGAMMIFFISFAFDAPGAASDPELR
jgi:hypothetical protein